MKQKDITESRPLKNIARENAKKPEKKKRACVTSCRPVKRTVNHKIPCVRRVHKYCFLLRQPKRSAIHRRRINVISRVILTKLYCLKIGRPTGLGSTRVLFRDTEQTNPYGRTTKSFIVLKNPNHNNRQSLIEL